MPKAILVVDDAHASLAELAGVLGAGGYSPFVLDQAEETPARFAELAPELVFVSLGAAAPFAVCDGIREHPDGAIVPIVLVGAGHPEVRTPAEALNKGADFYFSLPVDRAKVLAKVQTYVGRGERTPQAVTRLAAIAAAAVEATGLPPPPTFGDPLSALVPAGPAPAGEIDGEIDVAAAGSGATPGRTADGTLVSSADALLATIRAKEVELGVAAAPEAGERGAEGAAAVAVAPAPRSRPERAPVPIAEALPHASAPAARRDAAARRTEEEAWRRTEVEVQRHADEEARRQAEDELRRRVEEEARRRVEQEVKARFEEEARRRVEEELARRLEDETRRRIEDETRRKLEDEARRRAEALTGKEAELRRRVEEELRRQMGLAPAGAPPAADARAAVVAGPPPPAPRAASPPRALPPGVNPPTPEEGAFEPTHDVVTILFALWRQQVTGRVDFSSQSRQKSIFFERGVPVDAYSSQVYDRIEEYLLREGRITRAQYQDVRVKGLRGPRRIAAHLAAEGFLKPEELFGALRGHLQETLCGLLEWEDGAYQYLPERAAADDRVTLDLDLRAVLLEGIRRKYVLARMVTRVGGPSSLVALRSAMGDLEPLRLTPEEREAAKLLDGTRSLEDVVFATGLEALRVYHVVSALVAMGHAEVAVRGIEGAGRNGAGATDAIDRERIADKLEQVRNLDYFQVLGVSRTATPFEIDRAYDRIKNEFHPGRFSVAVQEEMQDPLAEIERVLEEARSVLRDEPLRDAYARHIPA